MAMEFSPQYPASLVEQTTEFLTNAIIVGQFKSGERLVESDLQRRFGISRSPIRESLRILERNGLVVSIPRKGTYVKKVSRKDITENFPITANLEGLAARLALPHLKPKDIKKMESSLLNMEEAAKKNDFRSYLRSHYDFNDTFIIASHNDALVQILGNLRNQILWFRYHNFYVRESYNYAIKVHREIFNFFLKKDPDQLEALIREHAFVLLDQFLVFIEKEKEDY
jgi:DNA-binding GntR family transcriptional regulator